MTAALAHRAPARLPHVPRPSRDDLLDLLADAREELRDGDEAIVLALLAVRLVAKHSAAPVLGNPRAEARVLGALLIGRATLADVADLDPGAFVLREHRYAFAVVTAILECCPVPPPGQPHRARVTSLAVRVLKRLPGGTVALGEPEPRWREMLEALPWPATCPVDAIARVRELARERRGL